MDGVFLLKNSIKSYEWGKLGIQSIVAHLHKSAFNDFRIDDNTTYAELWMGTHPSGPSFIPSLNDIELLQWIQQNPDCLGSKVQKEFGHSTGLPFLFKVLSVNKPLSIQAHPDKTRAKKLHQQFKDHYPDENHKPEMAIALTKFEALCGFRPLEEIKKFVEELKQLQRVISNSLFNSSNTDDKVILKEVFTELMTCNQAHLKESLLEIKNLFENGIHVPEVCKPLVELFLRIHTEYPGDVGCFSLFFMNYIILNPGEAIFLAANEPHAYLRGDCIECMACSDNVVRAGLTPKYKDVKTLCEMLTYSCRSAEENLFSSEPDPDDSCVTVYDPPVKEFTVERIKIPMQDSVYILKTLDSASVLLVVEGKAVVGDLDSSIPTILLQPGSVLFISSGSSVELHVTNDILMFRAYTRLEGAI